MFSPPYHPYTEALPSAVPIADTRVIKKRIVLDGDIPSAMNPPPGLPVPDPLPLEIQEDPGGLRAAKCRRCRCSRATPDQVPPQSTTVLRPRWNLCIKIAAE